MVASVKCKRCLRGRPGGDSSDLIGREETLGQQTEKKSRGGLGRKKGDGMVDRGTRRVNVEYSVH